MIANSMMWEYRRPFLFSCVERYSPSSDRKTLMQRYDDAIWSLDEQNKWTLDITNILQQRLIMIL